MAAVTDPSHIKALDDRRVAITMDAPNLLLMKNNTMHNTSALDIKDVKAHATSSDKWATDYFKKNLAPGNEPFMLDEYVPGDRIVLKANPNYYGTKPKLAKVIQKIVPDAAERELLIKRGEVDMIMVPPVQDLNTLKQDSGLQVLTFPNPRNLFLEMNNKMAPFNEQEQGRKLHMWIDEWLSWVNDPWYHMSWNVSSTSPTNYVSYSNPAVDALVSKWTLSLDKEGRIQGSKDAQKLVIADAPHAFLVGPNWNVVLRSNVKGYVYYNDELNRYAYMYKA